MLQILSPNDLARSVFDIDLDRLKERGISGMIVDLDNTLLPWENDNVPKAAVKWIADVKERGFSICIASNGMANRVQQIAKTLGVPAISKAIKPRKRPFREALKILKLRPSQVAVVGDQVFTDVLGGNRMGLYTILINPVSRKELGTTRIVRRVERRVIASLHRKGLLSEKAFRIRTDSFPSSRHKQ